MPKFRDTPNETQVSQNKEAQGGSFTREAFKQTQAHSDASHSTQHQNVDLNSTIAGGENHNESEFKYDIARIDTQLKNKIKEVYSPLQEKFLSGNNPILQEKARLQGLLLIKMARYLRVMKLKNLEYPATEDEKQIIQDIDNAANNDMDHLTINDFKKMKDKINNIVEDRERLKPHQWDF